MKVDSATGSTQPLFDTEQYRRHIEAAYLKMWELWQQGHRPRSFAVEQQRQPPSIGVDDSPRPITRSLSI